MTVENMVCPECARTQGHAHAPGCPRDMPDVPDAYIAGWRAARTAYGDLARWAQDQERQRIAGTLRDFAHQLEHTVTARTGHPE